MQASRSKGEDRDHVRRKHVTSPGAIRLRRKRTPRQKVPGRHFAYPPVRKMHVQLSRVTNVELGVVLLKTPQPRLDPRKNQNGTLAKDALLMEKFISAESVR